ncbi:hypothetical protein HNR33_003996 [Brassicibacter mesophilus]
MKKYKGIIILFLIEILCLFLTLIAGINLEIFFIFWVFISILSIVYIYIGKPKKIYAGKLQIVTFLKKLEVNLQF